MATWITDAQFARTIRESDIHQTQEIKRFLGRDNEMHFILVASKGMGKTLLMRAKRQQLQQAEDGVVLIPYDNEMDAVTLPSSFDNTLLTSLSDQSYWTYMWQTAIMASVLANSRVTTEYVKRQQFAYDLDNIGLPNEVLRDIRNSVVLGEVAYRAPSEILDALLQQGKSGFEAFRRRGFAKLVFLFRHVITNGCAVFIDGLDQELEKVFPGNLAIWRAGQLGLMSAAWEINRLNRHVKAFATIRQEAFASFDRSIKGNIIGSSLLLKYNDGDLRRIFEIAIRNNDGPRTIEDFFGFSTIHNHYINQDEDIFSYVKRHTINVPRWLIILGGEIADLRESRGKINNSAIRSEHQHVVAQSVNAVSALLAKDYISSEMRIFFGVEDPNREVSLLLKNVQSTILTPANINRLQERYEQSSVDPVDQIFALLMNIGLIGHLDKNVATPYLYQRFKMPFEFDWSYKDMITTSRNDVFLLHPSLHQIAHDSNHYFKYYGIRISNGQIWSDEDQAKMTSRRFGIFISYSSLDWASFVEPALNALEAEFNLRGEFVDIWLDRDRMQAAAKYLGQMVSGNAHSEFMLLFASANSLQSSAVEHEVTQRKDMDFANSRDTLYTMIIDNTSPRDLPLGLSTDHILIKSDPKFTIAKLANQFLERFHREKEELKGGIK